jgi:hypothetical protein
MMNSSDLNPRASADHEGRSSERAPLDHLPLAYHFLFDWDKSGYSTRRTLFHQNPHRRSIMRWIVRYDMSYG